METLTFVLRITLVVLGLALLALSAGSLTRAGVGWPQRCRFVFVAGIGAVAALRAGELFGNDQAIPLWTLVAVNALFLVGLVGCVHFYREFPAASWPKR